MAHDFLAYLMHVGTAFGVVVRFLVALAMLTFAAAFVWDAIVTWAAPKAPRPPKQPPVRIRED